MQSNIVGWLKKFGPAHILGSVKGHGRRTQKSHNGAKWFMTNFFWAQIWVHRILVFGILDAKEEQSGGTPRYQLGRAFLAASAAGYPKMLFLFHVHSKNSSNLR